MCEPSGLQVQSRGHTEALMDSCVPLLDCLLSAGLHPSPWLEQLPFGTIEFHQRLALCSWLSALHLPLGRLPPLHGVLQLPGVRHDAPAGHSTPLRAGLLELAGPPAGQLPPGSGLPAQGEEAGLLPISGAHIVYRLLDPFALDELSVAVCWSRRRPPGGSVHR